MKAKLFNIRLTKESQEHDIENLNQFLESVKVQNTLANIIPGQLNCWSILVFYNEKNTQGNKLKVSGINDLIDEEIRIYEALKEWRFAKASAANLPAYMICANSELMSLAKHQPKNVNELRKISGFGEAKASKFGEDLISVIKSFSD